MRVEVHPESGYVWHLLCHSWVAPALVELDTGRVKSLHVAKAQAFWAAYSRLQMWARALTDTLI